MRVKDLLKKKPIVISQDATIREAASLMTREQVGLLVLVDLSSPSKPVAVVSERDIIRAVSRGMNLDSKVETISSKKIVTVLQEDDVGAAAAKINSNKIRHLVVLDKLGRLAGVLSLRDLVAEKATLQAIISSYQSETLPGGD